MSGKIRKKNNASGQSLRAAAIFIGFTLMWSGSPFSTARGQETSTRVSSKQDTFSIRDSDFSSVPLSLRSRTSSRDDILGNMHVRHWTNTAFNVGEHLVFDIVYGIVKAGTATMSVPDTQWVEDRACFHIVTTAESSPFFSTFFRVEDRLESWMDTEGLFPWRHEKHIREGRYRSDKLVTYDQRNLRVFMNEDTMAVPPFVQGILSSFYFVRTLPLEVGTVLNIDTYGDGKLYPLKVLVHKKEEIRVPAGRFQCILLEPKIEGKGIFNQTGRLTIWVTDDERRIPVLVKSKVFVGSVAIRLVSFQ
jgi:hypothetical protein